MRMLESISAKKEFGEIVIYRDLFQDVTDVFTRNKASKANLVFNRGGARSSKTYSIVQLMIERLIINSNYHILMLRKSNAEQALYKTVEKMTESFPSIITKHDSGKAFINFHNQSVLYILNYNNHVLNTFFTVHEYDFDSVFIDEANEFFQEEFYKISEYLVKNQLFLAFNPTKETIWIKNFISSSCSDKTIEEIHSNYKDNPFLSKEYSKNLEDLKNLDREYYQVYTLGEWE